ncbi:MAG: antibiotic biosynthesis monooxygenase [Acidobacteriota bacterium]|nr:antibiotic biosynthesis monooxygenase [Acidobacteriota bacterium]
MDKTALFIRHQAQPGKRDEVRRVWEKHVKPRVEANPAHEAYFFCYDDNDPDVICVFQLYTDMASMQDFLKGAWYADYLSEVSQFIEAQPQISPATLVWAKGFNIQNSHGRSRGD